MPLCTSLVAGAVDGRSNSSCQDDVTKANWESQEIPPFTYTACDSISEHSKNAPLGLSAQTLQSPDLRTLAVQKCEAE